MANFITDGASALPPAKQDSKTPTGSPVEVAAEDMNEIRQALIDIRDAVLSGTLPGVDQPGRDAAGDAQDAADQAAQDAAEAANTAAGKNKTFYQDAEPAIGMAAGDLWFDTNDAYKVYRYNGPGDNPPSQWQAVSYVPSGDPQTAIHTYTGTAQDREDYNVAHPGVLLTGDLWFTTDEANRAYRWDGGEWDDTHDSGPILSSQIGEIIDATMLMDGSVLADALGADVKGDGNAPVAWLAANAIGTQHLVANAVTAGKVAAGVITAGNLTVANFSNLWPNGNAEVAPPSGADTTKPEWKGRTASAAARSGGFVRQFVDADYSRLEASASPGERFTIDTYARVTVGASTAYVNIFFQDKDAAPSGVVNATISGSPWQNLTVSSGAAPAGTVKVVFGIGSGNTGTTAQFDTVIAQKMVESNVIVDGAVIARTIQAGAIRADHIAAKQVTAGNMAVVDWTNLFPNPDGDPRSRPGYPDGTAVAGTGKAPTEYPDYDPEYRWAAVVADSPTEYAHHMDPTTISGEAYALVNIPAAQGDSFYMQGRFRRVSGATGAYGLYFGAKDKDGNTLTAGGVQAGTAWAEATYTVLPLTDASTASIDLYVYVSGDRVVDVTQLFFRRRSNANLIVDGAITSDKLYTEAVIAGKVAANAISAKNITVSDTMNLWPNGFSDPPPGTAIWPPTGSDLNQAEWQGVTQTPDAYSGGWCRRIQMALNNNYVEVARRVQAKAGDNFRIEAQVKTTPGDADHDLWPVAYVLLRFYNASNVQIQSTVIGSDAGQYPTYPLQNAQQTPNQSYIQRNYWAIAPANTAAVDFVIGTLGGNTTASPAIAYFDSIYCHRRTGGELIVDGSITASKISAGSIVVTGGAAADVNAGVTTIEGGKIKANTITANSISSNAIQTPDYNGVNRDTVNEQCTTGSRIRVNAPGTGPGIITAPAGIKIGTKTLDQTWLTQMHFVAVDVTVSNSTAYYTSQIGNLAVALISNDNGIRFQTGHNLKSVVITGSAYRGGSGVYRPMMLISGTNETGMTSATGAIETWWCWADDSTTTGMAIGAAGVSYRFRLQVLIGASIFG